VNNRLQIFGRTVDRRWHQYIHTPVFCGAAEFDVVAAAWSSLIRSDIEEMRCSETVRDEVGGAGDGIWWQCAVLIFEVTGGEYYSFRIPCVDPAATYILPSGLIDTTHADIVALASYLLSNPFGIVFCDEFGRSLVGLRGGYYGFDIAQNQ
jgi:hypothetical protein